MGFILAFLVFLAIIFLVNDHMRPSLIGGLLGGVALVVILRFIVIPMQGRRQYRKYKAIQGEFAIELEDEGLQMTFANGYSLVRWDQTLKWREDEQFILIFPMPRIYYVVPKHVASQGFNVELLRQKLTSHVGPAK